MSIPKPSVCVILVRRFSVPSTSKCDYQVLLAKRPKSSRVFPGVHVFPGGIIDQGDSLSSWNSLVSQQKSSDINKNWSSILNSFKEDEFTRRIASIRELFEETNILLSTDLGSYSHKSISKDDKKEADWFPRWCSSHEVIPDIGSLIPFARWITPEVMKARFDTVFYLAPVLESQCNNIDINHGEIDSLDWYSPSDALIEYEVGNIQLAPPTLVKLTEMSACPKVDKLMNPLSREVPEAILPIFSPASADRPAAILLPGDGQHVQHSNPNGIRRVEKPGTAEQKYIFHPNMSNLSNIDSSSHSKL